MLLVAGKAQKLSHCAFAAAQKQTRLKASTRSELDESPGGCGICVLQLHAGVIFRPDGPFRKGEGVNAPWAERVPHARTRAALYFPAGQRHSPLSDILFRCR